MKPRILLSICAAGTLLAVQGMMGCGSDGSGTTTGTGGITGAGGVTSAGGTTTTTPLPGAGGTTTPIPGTGGTTQPRPDAGGPDLATRPDTARLGGGRRRWHQQRHGHGLRWRGRGLLCRQHL